MGKSLNENSILEPELPKTQQPILPTGNNTGLFNGAFSSLTSDNIQNIGGIIGATLGVYSASSASIAQSKESKRQSTELTNSMINAENEKNYILEQIDTQLGQKMSVLGLESLKAEAKVRVATAENGITGGSNEAIRHQVFMAKAIDAGRLMNEASGQKRDLAQQMIARRSQYISNMSSVNSNNQSSMASLLSVISGAVNGYRTGATAGYSLAYNTSLLSLLK